MPIGHCKFVTGQRRPNKDGMASEQSATCRVCSQRLAFALNLTLSMQTLVQKIEANAAARLALPPGVAPAQELARFKNFVKVESHRLKMMHRAGGGGVAVCRARTAMMDILIRHMWMAAKGTLSQQAQKEFPPL